jgi:hypothetical protein
MTRLLVAGETPTGRKAERKRLSQLQDALLRLGVVSPGEDIEPLDLPHATGVGRTIVVVREQLDHLNALYCRAVLELTTFASFEAFVTPALDSGRHDLSHLGSLLDAPDTELVAVPYSRIEPGPSIPGPMLVTAIRMLHKRLTRVGAVRPIQRRLVRQAAAQVREHAETHQWDHTPYWGWPPNLAAEVANRFQPGNTDFARRVWRTDWPDLPVPREQTRIDLAGCPPATVTDVLTTIQLAVDGARTGDGSSGGGSEQA